MLLELDRDQTVGKHLESLQTQLLKKKIVWDSYLMVGKSVYNLMVDVILLITKVVLLNGKIHVLKGICETYF